MKVFCRVALLALVLTFCAVPVLAIDYNQSVVYVEITQNIPRPQATPGQLFYMTVLAAHNASDQPHAFTATVDIVGPAVIEGILYEHCQAVTSKRATCEFAPAQGRPQMVYFNMRVPWCFHQDPALPIVEMTIRAHDVAGNFMADSTAIHVAAGNMRKCYSYFPTFYLR